MQKIAILEVISFFFKKKEKEKVIEKGKYIYFKVKNFTSIQRRQ